MLTHNVRNLEVAENGRWIAWALLEQGLESAETTLLWLESLVADLNLSLEALAAGKLPPHFLTPSRLGWELVTKVELDERGVSIATLKSSPHGMMGN